MYAIFIYYVRQLKRKEGKGADTPKPDEFLIDSAASMHIHPFAARQHSTQRGPQENVKWEANRGEHEPWRVRENAQNLVSH